MSDVVIINLPGEPLGFARAGSRGGQRFTPAKQRNFMGALRMAASDAMGGREPLSGAVRMQLRASFLVPASWSKRKAGLARWKVSKPDLDNLVKIAKDAMNTIVYVDDAQIADMTAQKRYAPTAGLVITIEPLSEGEEGRE